MAALVEAQDHAEDEMIKSLRDAISKSDFVNDEADEFDALSFDILSRYLKARKGNVAEAKTMLEETLKWRKAFGVGNIHTKGYMKVIEKETFTGKTYVGGYCRDGHALLYMRPRRENSSEYDGNLKHVVYNLERCVESMKHVGSRWTSGVSLSSESGMMLTMLARSTCAVYWPSTHATSSLGTVRREVSPPEQM